MNKFTKKAYFKPATEVYAFDGDNTLMAGSPPVQPGGGGSGSVPSRLLKRTKTKNWKEPASFPAVSCGSKSNK